MAARGIPAFLDGLQLNYGPLDEFGAFFHRAYRAAQDYGVHLSFGTFAELMDVNRANLGNWRPIIPTFDPACSELTADNAFCILGRDRHGDVVATQAFRLFKWPTKSFWSAAEDLTLYYADPARDAAPGETCEVTAQAARNVHGRVAFGGAVWYRPDYRHAYLSYIIPRIARTIAFSRWSTDYTASMIQDSVFARGMGSRVGYPSTDWHVRTHNSPMGNITFAFVWMDPDYLIEDVRGFEALLDSEINSRVLERRA